MTSFLVSHGECWLWNWKLILLHAPADILTFLAYSSIALVAMFIYHKGRLSRLAVAYPYLWISGAGFVFFCALSHLGSFAEIWFGGWVYYVTGVNKVLMSIVSLWFAWQFFRLRNEIVIVGRVLFETDRQMEEEERGRTEVGL